MADTVGYNHKFVQKVNEDDRCGLCELVVRDPVRITSSCNHVFCEPCLNRWISSCKEEAIYLRCPLDESEFKYKDVKSDTTLRRLILNRTVFCTNTGCVDTPKLQDLQEHENTCLYRKVLCPSGCGKMILAAFVESHQNNDCSKYWSNVPSTDDSKDIQLTSKSDEDQSACKLCGKFTGSSLEMERHLKDCPGFNKSSHSFGTDLEMKRKDSKGKNIEVALESLASAVQKMNGEYLNIKQELAKTQEELKLTRTELSETKQDLDSSLEILKRMKENDSNIYAQLAENSSDILSLKGHIQAATINLNALNVDVPNFKMYSMTRFKDITNVVNTKSAEVFIANNQFSQQIAYLKRDLMQIRSVVNWHGPFTFNLQRNMTGEKSEFYLSEGYKFLVKASYCCLKTNDAGCYRVDCYLTSGDKDNSIIWPMNKKIYLQVLDSKTGDVIKEDIKPCSVPKPVSGNGRWLAGVKLSISPEPLLVNVSIHLL